MEVPQLEILQTRRREVIDRIRAMKPDERKRNEGAEWSPLGVLEHLNLVDLVTLANAEVRPGRGTRNIVMRLLVRQMRRGVPLPAPATLAPKGERPFRDLVAESDANHTRLAELVALATERDVIARHPFFGPLTAIQACDLLDSHYSYHLGRFPGTRR